MEPALILKHVSKVFTDTPGEKLRVLEDITLEIGAGEFFVIAGPSGSGKSTLLRVMSGLERSYEGTVQLGNGYTAKDLSFVFQQFALLPWMSVFENVELPLIARKIPEDKRRHIVMKELEIFGLKAFAEAHPKTLSGGMRQRVGLARAFAIEPKIIFLDEPFSELDSFTAEELRQDLLAIWQERKLTIVMVTHLIEEAVELADRIAVFRPLPGRIEKIVTSHISRPRNKRSEEFYRLYDELYALVKP